MQDQKQEWIGDLLPAQADRGAGERTDQGEPGAAQIPADGLGESE